MIELNSHNMRDTGELCDTPWIMCLVIVLIAFPSLYMWKFIFTKPSNQVMHQTLCLGDLSVYNSRLK